MELWNRTSGACGNGDKPLPWNVKTQGMAEAAKMLALLCCIDHENKHKSNDEMKELRRKLKLKGRSAREKFRKAQKRPLDPQNAKQAVDYLEESAERLESGEWNCKFVAAGLLATLVTLTDEFCSGK